MAKRLGPFWLALSLSGCVLNPIGEDPGYEENDSANILGTPQASGASPGVLPPSGPQGAAPVMPGAPLDPSTDGVVIPTDPLGPGVPGAGPAVTPPPPAGTSPAIDMPTPIPAPVGAGGASSGFGGSPGAGGAGPVPEPESEPDAMVPGMAFDGGTLNYGQDPDGGSNDKSGDGGLIDAGVGL